MHDSDWRRTGELRVSPGSDSSKKARRARGAGARDAARLKRRRRDSSGPCGVVRGRRGLSLTWAARVRPRPAASREHTLVAAATSTAAVGPTMAARPPWSARSGTRTSTTARSFSKTAASGSTFRSSTSRRPTPRPSRSTSSDGPQAHGGDGRVDPLRRGHRRAPGAVPVHERVPKSSWRPVERRTRSSRAESAACARTRTKAAPSKRCSRRPTRSRRSSHCRTLTASCGASIHRRRRTPRRPILPQNLESSSCSTS